MYQLHILKEQSFHCQNCQSEEFSLCQYSLATLLGLQPANLVRVSSEKDDCFDNFVKFTEELFSELI